MRNWAYKLIVATGILLAGVSPSLPGAGEGNAKVAIATTPQAAPGDWPWWRGPALDGTSGDRDAVTSWSATENVLWKAKVPGRGHASPVVVGDRVYLTTADETAQQQLILALDRKTGKPLWSTVAHEKGFVHLNPKNSHASATPAWDGQRLLSVFLNRDALHVTATDHAGTILWQAKAGEFRSEHGYGSSPVLYKDRVIVLGDNLKSCYVTALDTRNGKPVWTTPRKATGKHGSYATPVIANLAGRPQLIVTGMGEVTAYDPDTGKLLWSCTGPSEVTACTPAVNAKLVFATGGFPEKALLAIRADGTGDITRSHVAWRTNKGVAYVPSPLYHAGRLYLVTDAGLATCFDANTGAQHWQERLEGAFTASPILVDDRLYLTNEAGRTYVLSTGGKARRLATNDLGEPVLATPAVGSGQVFLRTNKHLYCLGKQS